jgi:hypothetical protein
MKRIILFLLLLSQNYMAQNMNEFRLMSGEKFILQNVMFENRDTLFVKLDGYDGFYKVAIRDIGQIEDQGILAVRSRNFNEKKNAFIGIYLTRLGALALAPVSMTIALFVIVADGALTWPKINTSIAVGTIPTIAIFIAAQVRAHDYKTFKKAKNIKKLT